MGDTKQVCACCLNLSQAVHAAYLNGKAALLKC